MIETILIIGLFIALAVAARYLGVDSTDGISSCEWNRRWRWYEPVDDQVEYC